MAAEKTNRDRSNPAPKGEFRISKGPVVRRAEGNPGLDLEEIVELPRVYGPPVLFAIARDPRTIFTYWNIDWAEVFEKTAPVDRQVHLRVYRKDGTEETSVAAEPMAGSCYLNVSQPRSAYRAEIGYYQPQDQWRSVATSDEVTMPPDRVSENLELDLATIPFHLGFQRLVDLLRASNGDALATILARLQKRALTAGDRDLLTSEEWEILRAMELSLDQLESARRAFTGHDSEAGLRPRLEALLGFGSTSPVGGFGPTSWGSAAS